MPVPKNKPTTSSLEGSTPQSVAPIAPDQEEFRQHLGRLAGRLALRVIPQRRAGRYQSSDLTWQAVAATRWSWGRHQSEAW